MPDMHEIEEILAKLSRVDQQELAMWMNDRIAEPRATYGKFSQRRLTVDEYLQLEEHSTIKHEYVAGEVFAMSGANVRHNLIVGNLAAAFHNHLRGGPCRVFMADLKLRLQVNRDDVFYYPDVMVACGEHNKDAKYLRDPTLIIEVLSPSTERTDRGEKALGYREIVTLEEYVLVAQARPEITIQRRSAGWQPEIIASLDGAAEFNSVALSLALRDIYEGAL